jgi:hypothetical protein
MSSRGDQGFPKAGRPPARTPVAIPGFPPGACSVYVLVMPQPEHRPSFVIADDLAQVRIWELIDSRVTVMVGCDACHHTARWSPEFMTRRLARLKAATLQTVAYKVRCGRCRSSYVRLWRG